MSGELTLTDAPRSSTAQAVARSRVRRTARRRWVIAVLAALIVLGYIVSLLVGQTFYSPAEVLGVILGQDVPGAGFTVGRLRLPRATTCAVDRSGASATERSRVTVRAPFGGARCK